MIRALMQDADYFDARPAMTIINIVPFNAKFAVSAANIVDWAANAGKSSDQVNRIGNRNQIGLGLRRAPLRLRIG